MHNEKEKAPLDDIAYDSNGSKDAVEFDEAAPPASGGLARELKGRHMQMIAIGTASQTDVVVIIVCDKLADNCANQVVQSVLVFSSALVGLYRKVVPAHS